MATFIHKHPLPDAGRVIVRLSHPATILSVGYQNTQLVLWAIENPEAAPRAIGGGSGRRRPCGRVGASGCCGWCGGGRCGGRLCLCGAPAQRVAAAPPLPLRVRGGGQRRRLLGRISPARRRAAARQGGRRRTCP